MARRGGRKWIQSAIRKPGALTRSAERADMSPMEFAREHRGDPGTTGRRARLALTLRKLGKRRGRRSERA